MATYAELKSQAEELLKQAEALLEAEKAQAIKEARSKIADYNLTADDLGLSSTRTRGVKATTRKPSGNVYKGPGGLTWSGRGRKPKWVIEALDAGKSLEAMR